METATAYRYILKRQEIGEPYIETPTQLEPSLPLKRAANRTISNMTSLHAEGRRFGPQAVNEPQTPYTSLVPFAVMYGEEDSLKECVAMAEDIRFNGIDWTMYKIISFEKLKRDYQKVD